LSAEQLVSDLQTRGRHARYLPDVDAIVRTIAAEQAAGDIVVVMSNGGFGGIHRKLLDVIGDE
jgi:UDP-N-acetylmuramate: L-alanyl-gamma-D-glutamyl-meso-diaminopimelate ligase